MVAAVAKKKETPSPVFVARPELTAQLAAQMVARCKARYEAGDAAALLDAIDWCARSGLPMPSWLAEAFCERYVRWVKFEGSLDEVFAVQRPKGKHIQKRARREWLRPRVVMQVTKLNRGGAPLDDGTFELVGTGFSGTGFSVSGGLVKKIYYEPASAWLHKLLRKARIS
jgi:hypothetical protein